MVNEHSRDALEQTRIRLAVVTLGEEQQLKTMDFKRA